jgi:hypothetical protein
MPTTKDLGLVKSIFEGTTPPSVTSVLWRDMSLTIPLLKQYNPTTSSWDALVYFTLIDNITIKKDSSGKLYVDVTTIPALTIADGSIALSKIVNFPSGTVLYRRSAATGVIEATSLAQLKSDLGLIGENSGDQNLAGLVPTSRKVNGKALTGDITLGPADIGSPSGSGTSTNTNSGDETRSSILTLLGITTLEGDNTGDQDAAHVAFSDASYTAENVSAALVEVKTIADATALSAGNSPYLQPITLPAYASVAARCSNASSPANFPAGWTLVAGSSEYDLKITHGLNKNFLRADVFEVNGDTTERQLPPFSVAYTGILQNSKNEVLIEGLTQDVLPLRIELIFES